MVNIHGPKVALSANIAPLKWLDGGLSFALNTYYTGSAVDLVHPSKVNFFIGMDHIIGKLKEFRSVQTEVSMVVST